MMESEVLEVKELIQKLRVSDVKLRVFGASSHGYQIGPCLSETEILAFEKSQDITLPEDYRLYLHLVGNGSGRPPRPYPWNAPWGVAGAGPGYGLYPLAATVNGDRIRQPFPFEEEIEVPDEPPYSDWQENVPGALEISTKGCASHTNLIVKGKTYGTIWEGDEYIYFTPTNNSFLQWMRNWAEKALCRLANEAVVGKLAVGMTKEQVRTVVPGDWKERKNQYTEEYYFESSEVPAQLRLSKENGVISEIEPWPFI